MPGSSGSCFGALGVVFALPVIFFVPQVVWVSYWFDRWPYVCNDFVRESVGFLLSGGWFGRGSTVRFNLFCDFCSVKLLRLSLLYIWL